MRPRRHIDDAGALEVAVDGVSVDGVLDGVEVLEPELLEQLDLVGEALLPVGDAVGQTRLHEAAVASARRGPDLGGVDEHDVARRIAFFGDDRRPQSRIAATDHAQIAALVAHEGRVRLRLVDVVEPVGEQVGVRERLEVPAIDVVRHRHGALISFPRRS